MSKIDKDKEFATIKDLKEAIRHIEKDHKFQLNEEVEIYYGNSKVCYGVITMSHFHICPTLILVIKKMEKK